jgi:hypothetical protein
LKRRLDGATYQLIKILSRQVGPDQSGGKPPHSKSESKTRSCRLNLAAGDGVHSVGAQFACTTLAETLLRGFLMKQAIISLLLAIGLHSIVWPPVSSSYNKGSDLATGHEKHSPEKVLEDFKILRASLEEGHSGIYRYSSKAELDRIFDKAAAQLTRPMDAVEFYGVVAPVVAAIKCGHTSVSLPNELRQEMNAKALLLPFNIKVIGKRVYVFRDLSGSKESLEGSEIISINDRPVGQILNVMLAAMPSDGGIETAKRYRLSGWRFGSDLLTLAGLGSPYSLRLRDAKSKREHKVTLAGILQQQLREAWQSRYPQDMPPTPTADLKFLDEGAVAVMRISSFGGVADAQKKKNLQDFYKESFEEVHAKGSKALIIDLRNNGGGRDDLGKLLLSYLVQKPFKYYDDLVLNKLDYDFMKYTGRPGPITGRQIERGADGKYHFTGHPNWGINQPGSPGFTGKVYILINGGSYSTTSEFLSQAHFHKRAVFIGEESAGGYYGNSSGMVPRVTLPNTKLALFVPLVTYHMAVSGYKHPARGIIPDQQVEYSISELLLGTDKELALALKLARAGK